MANAWRREPKNKSTFLTRGGDIGVALLAVGGAAYVRALLYLNFGAAGPFLPFFPAIIISALYGSFRAGCCATFLSAVAALFWIEETTPRLSPTVSHIAAESTFLLVGLTLSFICVKMRLAQEAAEERYKSFVEQSSEGIWRFEMEEPIPTTLPLEEQLERAYRFCFLAECNDALARMYGYSYSSDIIGARLSDFLPREDPHNVDYLTAFLTSGYRLENAESHERDRQGNPRYFLNNLVGIIENGSLVCAWGTQRDVTQQKETEHELRSTQAQFTRLANSIPQLCWIARPDGTIYWYNERWYEYTGLTPDELTPEEVWAEVHEASELPRVAAEWEAGIERKRPFEMQFSLKKSDGSYGWFLTRVIPVFDQSGKVFQWFGTNTDVTAQRHLAEERNQLLIMERAARTEAERVNQLKDEFLATLSHELRTPLHAILGWSQLLRQRSLGQETIHKGVEVIEKNARAQSQIIEDLLDMNRILGGKIRLDLQPTNLFAVIEAAIETISPALIAKHLTLEKHLDPEAKNVRGDPNRLQQVFWNLLSNAVKFTPSGGKVNVTLTRSDQMVEVKVRDNGQGINPTFLPYVFERFRQADSSSTRRQGGLGLGLSIVKNLVELQGGTVRVESEGEGKGSTFIVTLPLLLSIPGPIPLATPLSPMHLEALPLSEENIKLTGIKILAVDDEEDARELLGKILHDAGANVLTASSAQEALSLLSWDPQVIISDIAMPEKDGLQFIREVRARSSVAAQLVPAIALTAYAREEDKQAALLAGYTTHLVKPLEPLTLLTTIAQTLRSSTMDQQKSGNQ